MDRLKTAAHIPTVGPHSNPADLIGRGLRLVEESCKRVIVLSVLPIGNGGNGASMDPVRSWCTSHPNTHLQLISVKVDVKDRLNVMAQAAINMVTSPLDYSTLYRCLAINLRAVVGVVYHSATLSIGAKSFPTKFTPTMISTPLAGVNIGDQPPLPAELTTPSQKADQVAIPVGCEVIFPSAAAKGWLHGVENGRELRTVAQVPIGCIDEQFLHGSSIVVQLDGDIRGDALHERVEEEGQFSALATHLDRDSIALQVETNVELTTGCLTPVSRHYLLFGTRSGTFLLAREWATLDILNPIEVHAEPAVSRSHEACVKELLGGIKIRDIMDPTERCSTTPQVLKQLCHDCSLGRAQ
eukprot:gene2697-2080_t